ncbi:MAG: DUF1127 domain-containing protein [Mesorhizobium sp.]|nr:MAG: DUF1127 domain-containing protein [Mesorhizobium sp.]TIM70897.1 MAG: DUF1127 domain-containing protein [Mesorhizobium sp.]
MNDTLASAPHQAGATPVEPSEMSRRHLTTLRSIIAAWDERKRFRWELEQMSKDNPHLIDDIGLTRRQVEAEIAKPFWRR